MTPDDVITTSPAVKIFNVMNEATIIKHPSPEACKWSYLNDMECKLVLGFLDDPSTVTNTHLQAIHQKLRQPLRSSNLVKIDGYIFIHEHVNDDTYVKLCLVSSDLWPEIFLIFHSNLLGDHYLVY